MADLMIKHGVGVSVMDSYKAQEGRHGLLCAVGVGDSGRTPPL